MAGLFISYRRDDSAGWAGRLSTDLQQRFGEHAVFQDIGAIEAGDDFVAAIERSLESCSAVLVVIGPDWSTVEGKTGTRRLDEPGDTVSLEIARALARPDRIVIPVLVGGARMPAADELPPRIKALAQRNAFELSDTRWNYDLDKLAAGLAKKTGLVPKALPVVRGAKRWLALAVGAAFAVAALLAGYRYLMPRDGGKSPLAQFEITRPRGGETLPLGSDQRWMLEGALRLAAHPPEEAATPRLEVEVLRLPARKPVAQSGRFRVSTERGLWRYESSSFAGEGTYEILATVSFPDGRTDFRTITVRCVPKATAYLESIERDRSSRGADAVTPREEVPARLSALKRRVAGMQDDFFRVFPQDLDGAEKNARETLNLLDPVLPSHPDDWVLQNQRAYALKNYAMVMRNRDRPEEFKRALDEAEKMFEAIRQQKPDDPGAWNGLGSIAALRGELHAALDYIDRALEILPTYRAALQDRAAVQGMLERQQKSGARGPYAKNNPKVVVDTDRTVAESDEGNNTFTKEISVGQSGSAAPPDLYVSEFTLTPATPIQGQSVGVRVGVYNKGTAPAGAFKVKWFPGENYPAPACEWTVNSMAARGGRILNCTYAGYPGWYAKINTKVVVDTDRTVSESDEGNNTFTKEISVSRP